MKNSFTIIGAGAWGSALAIALSNKFDQIFLIAKNKSEIDAIGNQHWALSTTFNDNILLTKNFNVIDESSAILIATPSYAFSNVLDSILPHIGMKPVAWATKGFNPHNGKLLHETFSQKFPNHHPCIISGPTFAAEVANKKPAAIVVASMDKDTRELWANIIQTNSLRTYTNQDIVGVQVGGSVKNILAIAAGISSELGFGANAQAALITRGLAEMTIFGIALGAEKITFQGLSGMGDLVLTCSDDLSRNRRFGKELANNVPTEKALKNINATVEGFSALRLVIEIAKKLEIEMPICEQVMHVTQGTKTPLEAVNDLLQRQITQE